MSCTYATYPWKHLHQDGHEEAVVFFAYSPISSVLLLL